MRLDVTGFEDVGPVLSDNSAQLRYCLGVPPVALRDRRHGQSGIPGRRCDGALAGAPPVRHHHRFYGRQTGFSNYSQLAELNDVARRSGYGRTFNQCEYPDRLSRHRNLLGREPKAVADRRGTTLTFGSDDIRVRAPCEQLRVTLLSLSPMTNQSYSTCTRRRALAVNSCHVAVS